MDSVDTIRMLVESDIVKLCALVLIICAFSLVYIVRSNNKVLNRQMENEGKRDKREDKQLEETKRNNRKLEELLDNLIKKEDERFTTIRQGFDTIHASQEEIKEGVRAMNSQEMTEALQGLQKLIEQLVQSQIEMVQNQIETNAKLDRVLAQPVSVTDVAAPPGDKTQPLAIPGATVKEQKAAKLIDSEENE